MKLRKLSTETEKQTIWMLIKAHRKGKIIFGKKEKSTWIFKKLTKTLIKKLWANLG